MYDVLGVGADPQEKGAFGGGEVVAHCEVKGRSTV